MNRFEKLKGMEMPDAKKFLTELLGDKAEILFEDLRETVKIMDAKEGSVIKYGGIEWVVLARGLHINGDLHLNGVLVVAKECLFESAFDSNKECNNWAKSPLRGSLNSFNEKGYCACAGLTGIKFDDLIEFERDLTTDDGMTEYGTCKDYISLYTCDEYRRFRKLIPNCGKWHWTITGDSLEYSCNVRSVYSDGSLFYYDARGGVGGVRPLCILKSDTLVEVNKEE